MLKTIQYKGIRTLSLPISQKQDLRHLTHSPWSCHILGLCRILTVLPTPRPNRIIGLLLTREKLVRRHLVKGQLHVPIMGFDLAPRIERYLCHGFCEMFVGNTGYWIGSWDELLKRVLKSISNVRADFIWWWSSYQSKQYSVCVRQFNDMELLQLAETGYYW